MELEELSRIPTIEEFNKIKKDLNLTKRQKQIFYLKFSLQMRIADIAAKLSISRDTVFRDLTDIRQKVLAVEKEQLIAFVDEEDRRQAEEKAKNDKRADT